MKQTIEMKWVPCSVCGGNTRKKVRSDTLLRYCFVFGNSESICGRKSGAVRCLRHCEEMPKGGI